MAIIKCPECGREKVSDSAESCPDCGYGIKAHFDRIKAEETRQKQIKKLEFERKQIEIHKKNREEERVRNVPKPTKPRISIIGLCIATFCFLMSFILGRINEWDRQFSIIRGDGDPYIHCLCLIITGILVICIVLYLYNEKIKKYDLAQTDFEEYQKQIIREQDRAIANANAQAAARARELVIKPECPYCHSHNTTKITTTAKVVNTAMFGVLGQKRKHEWHCNNCKSNF